MALGAALALLPTAAGAVRVTGYATGVIDEYAYTDGNGAQVFGLDESELLGTPFRIDFAYDTDLAPPDADTDPDRAYHSSHGDPDWLDLAITVNGTTVSLRGDSRYADILDGTPANGSEMDWIQLGIDFVYTEPEEPDFSVYRREFLDFVVSMPNDVLSSALLPAELSSNEIIRVYNSANFALREYDQDPDTGELSHLRIVEFSMDIQQISASPVPEPASTAQLAAGVLALAALYRRRT